MRVYVVLSNFEGDTSIEAIYSTRAGAQQDLDLQPENANVWMEVHEIASALDVMNSQNLCLN